MTTPNSEKLLTELLSRLAAGGPAAELTKSDISLLANSVVPSSPKTSKNIAFLCLTKYCELVSKGRSDEDRTKIVVQKFAPLLGDLVSESTAPPDLIPITALLASLFPLHGPAAVSLLVHRIVTNGETDESGESAPDALAVLLESAELTSPFQTVFADLLVQATGSKAGRELVRARAEEWLKGALDFGDATSSALCAVALSKLGREALPGSGQAPSKGEGENRDVELAQRMMQVIISPPGNSSAIIPTLEGLSVLSLQPSIKHHLASSPKFLRSLIALSPVPTPRGGSLPVTPRGSMDTLDTLLAPVETGLCYGITCILANLTARKPALSAEDQQIAKLRAMAISGKKGATPEEDPRDHEEAVKERVKFVIQAGVVSSLRGLVRGESRIVKESLGRLCLALIEDRDHRTGFVRDGGFKVLGTVVRDLLTACATSKSKSSATKTNAVAPATPGEVDVLPAFQALAKMIITTPPHLLFPPPHLTTSLDALTPLYHLLILATASLLQTFESLMALTNLASIDPSVANRIVDASVTPLTKDDMWRGSGREDSIRLVVRIEELMLDDNTMVRRAATELVCNLVSSPKGFEYWSGEGTGSTARAKSRLNVLLVMTNVDDLQTRLAAGGALAIVTESLTACQIMLESAEGKSVWKRVVAMFDPEEVEEEGEKIALITSTPPDEGIIHRAVIVLLNLVTYYMRLDGERKVAEKTSIKEAEVEESLTGVLRMNPGREVMEPAVECLKLLKTG